MSLTSKTQHTVGALFRYPTDLALVSVAALLAGYAITTFPEESTLRFLSTLAFVVFLPGYALTSFLFPARPRPRTAGGGSGLARAGGIDTIERLGLALGFSLALVPMVVLALPFTEWGLSMGPVTGALVALTLILAQLGAIRRLRLPVDDRFTVSLTSAHRRLSASMGTGHTRASAIVLILTMIAALTVLLYAFAAPMAAGGYTQLAIYTDEDGELVADMPDTAAPDQEIPITFQIHNNEGQPMNYTVVMQEQVVDDGSVVDRTDHREINATSESDDGGRMTAERTVTPVAEENETVRIVVLLYEDDAPATPTKDEADQYAYFWVTIETPPDAPGTLEDNSTETEPGADTDDEGGDDGEDAGDDDDDVPGVVDDDGGDDDEGDDDGGDDDEGDDDGGDDDEGDDDGGDDDEGDDDESDDDEGDDDESDDDGGDDDESDDDGGDDDESDDDGGDDDEGDDDEGDDEDDDDEGDDD